MSREPRGGSGPAELAEDLSALSRRGALSEPELRRLDMCLSASPSLRTLDQVGRDFDQMRTTAADDEVLAEKLAQAVKQRRKPTPLRFGVRWNRRTMAGLGAMSVLLISLGAAAGLWRARNLPAHKPATTAPAPLAAPGATSKKVSAMPAASAEITQPCPPLCENQDGTASLPETKDPHSNVKGAPLAAATLGAVSERVPPSPPADATKPGELFSSANAARRRGDLTQATKLYRQLQTKYPEAAEAALSSVLMARIELGRGAPSHALGQFDQYLRLAPGGSLTQEALQGRAQALGQLGRKDEQTAAYRELLRRFPESVYARAAREHLGVSQ